MSFDRPAAIEMEPVINSQLNDKRLADERLANEKTMQDKKDELDRIFAAINDYLNSLPQIQQPGVLLHSNYQHLFQSIDEFRHELQREISHPYILPNYMLPTPADTAKKLLETLEVVFEDKNDLATKSKKIDDFQCYARNSNYSADAKKVMFAIGTALAVVTLLAVIFIASGGLAAIGFAKLLPFLLLGGGLGIVQGLQFGVKFSDHQKDNRDKYVSDHLRNITQTSHSLFSKPAPRKHSFSDTHHSAHVAMLARCS